jgi:hypothetical protein
MAILAYYFKKLAVRRSDIGGAIVIAAFILGICLCLGYIYCDSHDVYGEFALVCSSCE